MMMDDTSRNFPLKPYFVFLLFLTHIPNIVDSKFIPTNQNSPLKIPNKHLHRVVQIHHGGGDSGNSGNSGNSDNNDNPFVDSKMYQMKPMTLADLDQGYQGSNQGPSSYNYYNNGLPQTNYYNNHNNHSNHGKKIQKSSFLHLFLQSIQNYFQQLYKISPSLAGITLSSILICFLWKCTTFSIIVPSSSPILSPSLLQILQNHFVFSKYHLFHHLRIHTMITYTISHVSIWNLFVNIYMVLQWGPKLISFHSNRNFMTASSFRLWPILLGSSVFGALGYLLFNPTLWCISRHGSSSGGGGGGSSGSGGNDRDGGCLGGLSGVTLSLFAIYTYWNPTHRINFRLFPNLNLNPNSSYSNSNSNSMLTFEIQKVRQWFSGFVVLSTLWSWWEELLWPILVRRISGGGGGGGGRRRRLKRTGMRISTTNHYVYLGNLIFAWIYVEYWKRGWNKVLSQYFMRISEWKRRSMSMSMRRRRRHSIQKTKMNNSFVSSEGIVSTSSAHE